MYNHQFVGQTHWFYLNSTIISSIMASKPNTVTHCIRWWCSSWREQYEHKNKNFRVESMHVIWLNVCMSIKVLPMLQMLIGTCKVTRCTKPSRIIFKRTQLKRMCTIGHRSIVEYAHERTRYVFTLALGGCNKSSHEFSSSPTYVRYISEFH